MIRLVCSFIVIFILLLQPISSDFKILASETADPLLLFIEPVTSGAVRKEYSWDIATGSVIIQVIEADLKDPYIKIEAIPGAGKLTTRATVTSMAVDTGAVSVINGDFFNTKGEGAPVGPMVIDSRIAASPALIENIFSLGISSERKAYIEQVAFDGNVLAPNGQSFILSGINKSVYWEEPGGEHSHANKLHLYNDLWGAKTRGNDSYTTPTEMLIENGKVIKIVQGAYIDSPVPEGMQILRGHGLAAKFISDNFKPGDDVIIEYNLSPDRKWSMMIGGHGLLVDDNTAVPYAKLTSAVSGTRARTAVGINKEGDVLYLVCVQGNSIESKGIRLEDLARFLEYIGAYRALNLDGGGSTAMVSRPLGEWDVKGVMIPELGFERLVPNGIGIYTNAPEGKLSDLLVSGEEVLLIDESFKYTVKAYDEYYNPLDPHKLGLRWETSSVLTSSYEIITGSEPGTGNVHLTSGDIIKEFNIEVAGRENISKMILNGSDLLVIPGIDVPLDLRLETRSGKTKEISADMVQWQAYGFSANVTDQGILNVMNKGKDDFGYLVARYDDYSAPLFVRFAGLQRIRSFSDLEGVNFRSYPKTGLGDLSLVFDQGLGHTVASLSYDFTNTAETAAAYINFEGSGIKITEADAGIIVDVYGNGGNEWVRAEIIDSKGTLHRLDLSTGLKEEGWQRLRLDLQKTGMTYPLYLKQLYVVCPFDQRKQRSLKGEIRFKDLQSMKPMLTEPQKSRVIEITTGVKEMKIDSIVQGMDIAPVIIEKRTLVPVRFISEALGADILWDPDTKKVTVIYDGKWIDLWIGDDIMILNGVAADLDVPPKLMSGRTMLPLRIVAEALGLSVQWNNETKSTIIKSNGEF
jgi:trimeric autotransporter adhesin